MDTTSNQKIIVPKFKIWLSDSDGNYLLGSGGATLLSAIEKHRNLNDASDELNISYRKAWNILNKIKKNYGKSPVVTHRGGSGGGGGMELSETGNMLLQKIKGIRKKFENIIDEEF